MKTLLILIVVVVGAFLLKKFFSKSSRQVTGGKFIPDADKSFPYVEGDILLITEKGKYGLMKVLRVEQMDVKEGQTLNIAGHILRAPTNDCFCIVHAALGEYKYDSEASAAEASRGPQWMKLGHVPMRPSGLRQCIVKKLAAQSVTDSELLPYRQWRVQYDAGKAGIW